MGATLIQGPLGASENPYHIKGRFFFARKITLIKGANGELVPRFRCPECHKVAERTQRNDETGEYVGTDVPLILRNPAITASSKRLPDDLTNMVLNFAGSWKEVEEKKSNRKARKYIVCPKNAAHTIDLPINVGEMLRDNHCIRVLEDRKRLRSSLGKELLWIRTSDKYSLRVVFSEAERKRIEDQY